MTFQTELQRMSATEAARRLLGCELVRTFETGNARVRIVETEAYDQTDAASHSFNGRTPRTDIMFGPAGHLYVYFTYGMHYCMNVVVGPEDHGAAVLVRAVEPIQGEDLLRQYRDKPGTDLTNGPAKLCRALNMDLGMNGHDLRQAPLRLDVKPRLAEQYIVATKRIGITKDKDRLWRFCEAGNTYLSRK